MFYVYLLQSEKDKTYYIGQCENIEIRILRHNDGYVLSTKKRIPWKLLGFETFDTRREARWRERRLKDSFSEKRKFIGKILSP